MKISSWVLIFMGGLLIGVGVWLLATAYASTSWPVVKGRLVDAKVAARISQTGDALRRHLEYYIKVEYEYMFDRQVYRSSRYSLGTGETIEDGFYDKSEARAWLKQSPYQLNSQVDVHVDPKDPENTVLSAGIRFSTWIPIILGLVFIGLGLLIKWLVDKQQVNRPIIRQGPIQMTD